MQGRTPPPPASLQEPEAADLEISSDSFVGGEWDVEVVGATIPPNPSEPGWRRRRQAIRKVSVSKASMRGALPKGTLATTLRSWSEEPGAEDAPELSGEGAVASAARVEREAALGLTRMGSVRSPLLGSPLLLTFNVRCSGGYADHSCSPFRLL